MRKFLLLACAVCVYCAHLVPFTNDHPKDEWKTIFDGNSTEGWKPNEHPESWTVKDGILHGDGETSYLFYMGQKCVNCEFRATLKINHGGLSGMFVRAPFGPGTPKGYQAQINASNPDVNRTGSLIGFVPYRESIVTD